VYTALLDPDFLTSTLLVLELLNLVPVTALGRTIVPEQVSMISAVADRSNDSNVRMRTVLVLNLVLNLVDLVKSDGWRGRPSATKAGRQRGRRPRGAPVARRLSRVGRAGRRPRGGMAPNFLKEAVGAWKVLPPPVSHPPLGRFSPVPPLAPRPFCARPSTVSRPRLVRLAWRRGEALRCPLGRRRPATTRPVCSTATHR
jgi:hypothetical protein